MSRKSALAFLITSIPAAAFAQAVETPAPAAPDAAEQPAAPAPAEQAPAAPPAEAQAEPQPVAPAAVDTAPTPTTATEDPELETKVERIAVADEGSWQPGALLQTWFFLAHEDDVTSTTFRIRRAELSVKGELVPDLVSYKVMIDPAKLLRFGSATSPVLDSSGDAVATGEQVAVTTPPADTAVLQDVSVTFMSEYVDVTVGQFKNPVSYEGTNSSSKLLFPERALVSRQFGDRRDIGLKLDKSFDYFAYVFGVFNGTGLNQLDNNNQKDLALRLEAYPVKGITLGAVGYTSVGSRDEATTRDRVEGDLRVELADALVQGEYIRGWDGAGATRVEGHGFYLGGGYTFMDRLQPIVRVGMLDVDVDADDDEVMHYELGANYYLRKHNVKLQTSFSFFDPSAPGAPTRNELILSTQLMF